VRGACDIAADHAKACEGALDHRRDASRLGSAIRRRVRRKPDRITSSNRFIAPSAIGDVAQRGDRRMSPSIE